MDIVENIKTDKAYLKYKSLVKKWENDFKKKNKRLPSKLDIKEAPTKVRYAYKRYFEMKSAALENSLIDCSFDEDVAAPCSPEFLSFSDSFINENLSEQQDQILDRLPSSEKLEELLSKTCELKLPSPQKISKRVTPQKKKDAKKLVEKLSNKLLQNTKFSIRNPRKSLPSKLSQKSNSDISSTPEQSQSFDLSQNENIFDGNQYPTTTSQNTNDNSFSLSIVELSSPNPSCKQITSRHINDSWLERASGMTFEKPITSSDITESENMPQFGINNLNFSKSTIEVEETDLISVYVSDPSQEPPAKRSKIDENCLVTNHCTINDEQCIKKFNNHHSSDASDDEKPLISLRQKAKRKNIKQKKPKPKSDFDSEDKPPDIEEFVPIGIEKNLLPRINKESLKSIPLNSSLKLSNLKNEDELKMKPQTYTENYRKINIEKKVYVRGKKSFNFSKYKNKLNKDKKALHAGMEFPEGGKITCFKCGQSGHMARYCTAHKGDSLMALEAYTEDTLATIEEASNQIVDSTPEEEINHVIEPYITHAIPDSFLQLLSQTSSLSQSKENLISPIYEETPTDTTQEVEATLKLFGHSTFKPGQKQAILRILSGKSTLLVLSTGGGKSLCYQLPAYIYSQRQKCITLVISPLVSLMEDQVISMPEFLKAGCLHTNQPESQRLKIIELLKNGDLNILLISPEALVSGDKVKGLGSLFRHLPPIAFACIDEAHCVSQWSHNFRPSYLMICRVLREKLQVGCILGLTATASRPTVQSIIDHINIPDGYSGVITNPTLPDNLVLSVSYEKDKDRSLINLLSSETIGLYKSIIVYCIRRDECQRVAAVLRSSLQEPGRYNMEKKANKRKRMSYIAEAYHAGLSAAQRRKIQNSFMDGTLRIIVATVAFGMGINKSDIRCIIHYNMPSSFESYVQEVGRAGRDGLLARCHVFMNQNNCDKDELLKHIHANTIDRHVIRKLLQKVFMPCNCRQLYSQNSQPSSNRCQGHEVAFSIEETVEELDLASENIATLLCYLELHPKRYIKVLNNGYINCKIFSYGGPTKLLAAAKTCPPLAMAYALEKKKDPEIVKHTNIEFPVIYVSSAIGWESGITKYQLKNLEWIKDNGHTRRSALKVEFSNLGFRIRAPGDLSAQELDEVLDELHFRVNTQEKTMIYQLEEIFKAFSVIAQSHKYNVSEEDSIKHSNQLKQVIESYFDRSDVLSSTIEIAQRPLDENRAIADIKALITTYRDCKFTGRAIARILQGIQSPNYSALVWGRCKFWRSHIHEDFHALTKLATQQIIDLK